ncbi:MAG: hypothetical protein HYY30_09985 [Chloroflexi bacterium]|nr:hypothetical protein [Chloroflexota bacterium]
MQDDVRNLMCLKCCPKCGGALFRECDIYGCDVECLQCGYVMPRERLEEMLGKERTQTLLDLGKKKSKREEEPRQKRSRKSRSTDRKEPPSTGEGTM